MSDTVLEQLAALGAGAVPEAIAEVTPARVLDIVGIAVRATELDTSQAVIDFATDQGTAGQAVAIGARQRMSVAEAAFVNGVLAHSLDYDDTHLPSILHPSASVVPAALAVGQHVGASGADVADAVAVGLEIAVRLGMGGFDPVTRQSIYFERGQHATSICGAIGSAAAAARLLGSANTHLVQHAMGIAASMASGIIEANRTGGTVKRLHCGWAARSGVTAAQLAHRGVTGPPTAIEGRFGLFTALLGDEGRPDAVVDQIGDHWESERIFIKPYPANHFTHTGIDAAIALRRAGLSPDDVESAELYVAPPTVRTIGEPLEVKQCPETGYQAQFSGPYTVVAGLLGGGGLGVGLADFSDQLARDPSRRELMSRVTVHGDAALTEIYPYQFPARLEVVTVTGDRLIEEVHTNLGGPERPLSSSDLGRKFDDNVEGLLSPTDGSRLFERLMEMRTARTIDDMLAPAERMTVVPA